MIFQTPSLMRLSLLLALGSAELTCRPEGPVVPAPRGLWTAAEFQSTVNSLTLKLDAAMRGSINPGFPIENVSFSIGVVSLDQPDPGTPIWEYHHLATANTRGTQRLDKDSQYLIGSITKVFSDYLLLKSTVDLDAPVTQFIPELAVGRSRIQWEDVSLRMLGSHLAGAPTNFGFSEHYYLREVFQAYGFPPIDDSAYPPCGVVGLNGACSEKDFLAGMTTSYPYTAPMERPAYSNVAFTVFTIALERITGKTYAQLLDEFVVHPYGLKNTFPSPGNDSLAVIPPQESNWGTDYGLSTPGGGLVSSISDLSKFTKALLSRSLNMTASETRAWLKPAAFAGNVHSAVGLPWEIWRPTNLVPDHPHHVTLYTKGGGALMYRSQLAVIDEYGIGVIVLTAGQMKAVTPLTNAVIGTIVSAVDKVSRVQAARKYARRFRSSGANSTVEAAFDLDNDSLVLVSVQRNGEEMLSSITDLWNMIMAPFAAPIGSTVRLFPQELYENTTLQGHPVIRQVWRLWPDLLSPSTSELPGQEVDASNCFSWTLGDWVHYGSEPMDRVAFYEDEYGEVAGVEVPFLRSGVLTPL
ncbi:hypothetical protein S7711_07728 [Stachybotrys chartarum IBT 7711]|uniref:Uncharacterized protein n=1 Tax=Stachybotrys chartarum (strain CBS 109288 / IBT 7711) TaxID=1280523 RepID=A0A084B803_STACB|nr:hypothetical protein S7711_07728 [Stachybotrys chartarum IBT 7711]